MVHSNLITHTTPPVHKAVDMWLDQALLSQSSATLAPYVAQVAQAELNNQARNQRGSNLNAGLWAISETLEQDLFSIRLPAAKDFLRSQLSSSHPSSTQFTFGDAVRNIPILSSALSLDIDRLPVPDNLNSPEFESELALLQSQGSIANPPSKWYERLLNLFTATPPQITRVSPIQWTQLWGALELSGGERWIDLGSGNGRSLARIGHRQARATVVGWDIHDNYALQYERTQEQPAFKTLNNNTEFKVVVPGMIGPRHLDQNGLTQIPMGILPMEFRQLFLHGLILNEEGNDKAEVVSLLYPNPDALNLQIQTAMNLLKNGGLGMIVTENFGVLRETIDHLSLLSGLDMVIFSQDPLSGRALREIGVEPYTPFPQDAMQNRPTTNGPIGVFNWGYPIYFRKS